MPIQTLGPTPHQDINAALVLLLSTMKAVLGEHFIGLYLGGSLALGDFDPHRSDIDFVAVTAGDLPPELTVALEEMHSRLWNTGTQWARRLDGSYVPQQVFRHWTANHTPCPFVEEDEFYLTNQSSAVLQRHIIREHGVVVAGPHPHTLLDPVAADELRSTLQDILEKSWRPLLDDPAWLQQSRKQPFAVLTMCRTLYTLEHGVIASKPVAARWAQRAIDKQWTPLIEWALARSHATEANHLAATLSFIQHTVDQHRHQPTVPPQDARE